MKDKSTKAINSGQLGGIYFVTIIGAAVYFVQQSSGFWGVIGAILKAFVWPAFVVYDVLGLLQL